MSFLLHFSLGYTALTITDCHGTNTYPYAFTAFSYYVTWDNMDNCEGDNTIVIAKGCFVQLWTQSGYHVNSDGVYAIMCIFTFILVSNEYTLPSLSPTHCIGNYVMTSKYTYSWNGNSPKYAQVWCAAPGKYLFYLFAAYSM